MSFRDCAGLLLASCLVAWAQDYHIATVTGGVPAPTPIGATQASLGRPLGLAVNAAGEVFASADQAVFKVDRSGILTRVAGTGVAGYSGDGGPASRAQLNGPMGLALDGSGNLYIAEAQNQVVRKVSPDGTISTVAGIPCSYAAVLQGCGFGPSGDRVAATSVHIEPNAVATDSAGNLYLTDRSSLRKVDRSGIISTIAADPSWSRLRGVTVDSAGNLYSLGETYVNPASSLEFVLKVTPGGQVSQIAASGYSEGLAVDAVGSILLTWNSCCILRINGDGSTTKVAGSGSGFSGDGGTATTALLNRPEGMAFDQAGNLYIADSVNMRIRKVRPDGIIETFAGNGTKGYSGDGGPALSAQASADDVALDASGNVYFADTFNAVVRKLKTDGTVVTVAGISGQRGYAGDGGPATSALLTAPTGIATDTIGNLYLADGYRVRKVTLDGRISTIGGTGTSGYSGNGGPATLANIQPSRIAVDRGGNVYFPELNGFIRKIGVDGTITTVAGGGRALPGDGGRATDAQLLAPTAIAIDAAGNLFFADRLYPQFYFGIRKVTPDGTITRVAGYQGYTRPGVPISNLADIVASGMAFDHAGNLYIADTCHIHRMATNGVVEVLAGATCGTYSGEGGPATKTTLLGANGIAVDGEGRVFFADGPSHDAYGPGTGAVRVLQPPAVPLLRIGVTLPQPVNRTQMKFTLLVTNAALAIATNGTVTVTETLPEGMTLFSMGGTGWNCSGNRCTRTDSLAAGGNYPAITVICTGMAMPANPNQAQVAGGGSPEFGSSDYFFDVTRLYWLRHVTPFNFTRLPEGPIRP